MRPCTAKGLIQILSEGIIDDAPKLSKERLKRVKFFCRTCALAKSRRMSYRNMTGDKGPEPLHTLHLDSLGKIKIKGLYGTAGHMYALAIVDDATAYKWYFILKSLKKVGGKIKHLITQMERQLPYKVKKMRTDGGTEFVNKFLKAYCEKHGLIYQHSNVESQEENGSAE
jgi:hypothetical protein